MPIINDSQIKIMIENSTNNLMLNNYLNMKKIITDIRNYIIENNNDNNDNNNNNNNNNEKLTDEFIINLIKEYKINLLLNCYNNKYKNDNIKFKERLDWLYNNDYHNFSSALIQQNGEINFLNRIYNHYNDEGKFIYNQRNDHYYSALRLENNKNFLTDIFNIYQEHQK